MSNIRTIDIAITALLGLGILAVTLVPNGTFPETPGNDKLHHFIAFMAFAIPISLKRPRQAWVIFFIALALGGAIEIIQPYVSRSRDILDFRADAAGAATGALIGVVLSTARKLWMRRGVS